LDGDFNADGKVDGTDYGLIDAAFNSQGAALRPSTSPPPTKPTAGGKLSGGAARM
jgi:hypothetical protein